MQDTLAQGGHAEKLSKGQIVKEAPSLAAHTTNPIAVVSDVVVVREAIAESDAPGGN